MNIEYTSGDLISTNDGGEAVRVNTNEHDQLIFIGLNLLDRTSQNFPGLVGTNNYRKYHWKDSTKNCL